MWGGILGHKTGEDGKRTLGLLWGTQHIDFFVDFLLLHLPFLSLPLPLPRTASQHTTFPFVSLYLRGWKHKIDDSTHFGMEAAIFIVFNTLYNVLGNLDEPVRTCSSHAGRWAGTRLIDDTPSDLDMYSIQIYLSYTALCLGLGDTIHCCIPTRTPSCTPEKETTEYNGAAELLPQPTDSGRRQMPTSLRKSHVVYQLGSGGMEMGPFSTGLATPNPRSHPFRHGVRRDDVSSGPR